MAYVRSKMRSLGMKGKTHKGPLRAVKEVLRFGKGLFSHDSVIFECGHKGRRTPGSLSGRCRECGKAAKA